MRHGAERGSRGAGGLDAALPMPLHRRGVASRARAGLRHPAGTGTADGRRRAARHGPRPGCRLRRVPSGAEPRALVLACRRAPSPAAPRRRFRAGRPGGGRPRRHHRAALGGQDQGARHLPRSRAVQPRPLHTRRAACAGCASCCSRPCPGPAASGGCPSWPCWRPPSGSPPSRASGTRSSRTGAARRCCRSRAGCPAGGSSRWPTAASPPSPCCATSRRT